MVDVLTWFASHARPLPWRAQRDPWGILVSEIMGQQTPMSRVVPRWEAWMAAWPRPSALAAAPDAAVLTAWDRLGYPRRALNLKRAAVQLRDRHGDAVPADRAALLDLPGVVPYTAASVLAFAFGQRIPVLDTNVRRVLARYFGSEDPRSEEDRFEALVPDAPYAAEAVMELGALVCLPAPHCEACPLRPGCAWHGTGPDPAPQRRPQSYAGTDRQARGRILAVLRADHGWVGQAQLLAAARVSPDPAQAERALASLVADGLISAGAGEVYRLGRDSVEG